MQYAPIASLFVYQLLTLTCLVRFNFSLQVSYKYSFLLLNVTLNFFARLINDIQNYDCLLICEMHIDLQNYSGSSCIYIYMKGLCAK